MRHMTKVVLLVALCTGGCVRESYIPTVTTYTCAAQQAQLQTLLRGLSAPLPLPTLVTLPSGERLYLEDNGLVYHYDGPVCQ